MHRFSWWENLFAAVESLLGEYRTLFFLFRREKVFRYFLFLAAFVLVAGLLFLSLEYERVAAVHPPAQTAASWERLVTALYWSIVTISTCGYGDIAPGTTAGRLLVILVLFLSIATVSMFTANLASALTTKKLMERRGVMDLSKYRNHFILGGWKQAMNKLLDEIVYNNPRLDLRKIIVIANVEPEIIEVFHQQYPAFQKVTILRGEHYNEAMLRKANVAAAAQVFLLADESAPNASSTEMDSKTVMAAMTIRTLSRDVRICAELLDVQFESYLRSAHVEDIIYTNEYSKVLIANAFSQVGMAKVVNDLLSAHTPAFIVTESIPPGFLGKPFSELREHFRRHSRAILIGLVENAGSFHERKQEAVRQAQKTADVGQLVKNLHNARELEHNQPNLNPEENYPVPANALAVLVLKRPL
ncbi:MAG: ion channel [candidate division FCPU426 bacterium]